MSNLDYLVATVENNVPSAILDKAFGLAGFNGVKPGTKWSIINKVITDIVLRDCNMISGEEILIDLSDTKVISQEHGLLIKVPLNTTNGKKIISAQSVNAGFDGPINRSNDMTEFNMVIERQSSARFSVVGTNALFAENISDSGSMSIRVRVENDDDFGNITPAAMLMLGDLCILATKGYIYNELYLTLAGASSIAGQDFGAFSSMVDGYSDSMEMYRDLLRTKWRKVNIMSSGTQHDRLIRTILPNWA